MEQVEVGHKRFHGVSEVQFIIRLPFPPVSFCTPYRDIVAVNGRLSSPASVQSACIMKEVGTHPAPIAYVQMYCTLHLKTVFTRCDSDISKEPTVPPKNCASIPGRGKIFFPLHHSVQTGSWSQCASYPMFTSFSSGKAAGA
jgi:hypothetical protein